MTFGKWEESIHNDLEQLKRIASANSLKSTQVQVHKENESAIIQGSGSSPYEVTLNNCTCFDFESRKLPCKHMYRLALELGLLTDLPALNKQASKSFNENVQSDIDHYFYLYKTGAISLDKFIKIATALQKGK